MTKSSKDNYIIGCMLRYEEARAYCVCALKESDFKDYDCRMLFKDAKEFAERGVTFNSKNMYIKYEGNPIMTDKIRDCCILTAEDCYDYKFYVRQLLNERVSTDIWQSLDALRNRSDKPSGEELLTLLQKTIDEQSSIMPFDLPHKNREENIRALKDYIRNEHGMSTGISSIDRALGGKGLAPGRFYVLSGKTGTGKSALGMQIAMSCVLQGKEVAVFGVEMSYSEITRRIGGQFLGITEEESFQYAEQIEDFVNSKDNLTIFDQGDLENSSIDDIAFQCRRVRQRRGHLDFALVDYIQIVESAIKNSALPRQMVIKDITRGLKKLAARENCVVLGLSQINRAGYSNEQQGLENLADSASIEQDADCVLMLIAKKKESEHQQYTEYCLKVAKSRNSESDITTKLFRLNSLYRFLTKDEFYGVKDEDNTVAPLPYSTEPVDCEDDYVDEPKDTDCPFLADDENEDDDGYPDPPW